MSQKLSSEIQSLVKQLARVEAKLKISPHRAMEIASYLDDRNGIHMNAIFAKERSAGKLTKEESKKLTKLKRQAKTIDERIEKSLRARDAKFSKKRDILKKRLAIAMEKQNKAANKKIKSQMTKSQQKVVPKVKAPGQKKVIFAKPQIQKTIQKSGLKKFKKPAMISAAVIAAAISAEYIIQMRKEKKKLEEFKKKLNAKKK